MVNKKTLIAALLLPLSLNAVRAQLPLPTPEARPGLRWWWFGSAVDKPNLAWNMEQYARAGVGTVEITPIYGVQGNERNDIAYLSPKWMEMLRYTEDEGRRNNIEIDMATGTGWPFGGPWVPLSEAACKATFTDTVVNGKRRVTLHVGRTRQKVKRAAPGGEGWVIDHFDSTAVAHYLAHIDSAFTASGTPFPHTFFNDSYEVYGANWTPRLPEEFLKRRGYNLMDNLDKLVDGDPQVVSDYRETLAELLLKNFTNQWTAWAHRHGAITRNQAHGSPANLIDCYAGVDIPEIEGFGLTDFGIKGLRTDKGFTRPNFSDLSMLKYAPSAAHITGKKYTSSETFTWLTEHFRTSLSQMKPDLDLMFCAGVNRMFFHGTAYSPKDDPWPGWKFYASVDMSPTNSIWRDAPSLMAYITRCQTYLQWGQPDNDFLVYLPVRDLWREDTRRLLMMFDIHSMDKKAPQFIKTILAIDSLGYDCDYISDKYLAGVTLTPDGQLRTAAGTLYKGLVVPPGTTVDSRLQALIAPLQKQGKVICGIDVPALAAAARPEAMKRELGLKMIRRSNPAGHHYFVANLTPRDVAARVPLAVEVGEAVWYNPMDSTFAPACLRGGEVAVRLRSGESRILIVRDRPGDTARSIAEKQEATKPGNPDRHRATIDLSSAPWRLSFVEEAPRVGKMFRLNGLRSWEQLSDSARVTMGTGVYETTFKLTGWQASARWEIDLGDVRESARVYINGRYLGCAWAVPFVLDCRNALKRGRNTLRIEVTNLPANRIADMDRRGVVWRKMKEINVVDINYKKTTYAGWKPLPGGLNSTVKLIEK